MNGITEKRATRVDERFRFIFDSVGDGIFLCDAETGRLMDVNATACAMFGFSREELIGRPLECSFDRPPAPRSA